MDSEVDLRALFLYSTEGIIVTNSEGVITAVNPAAEAMFEYEHGELREKKIEILIPSRFSQTHIGHREGYMQKPHPRKMGMGRDLFGRKKEGTEFPVEISLSTFNNKDGHFVIAFIIDISLRKKHEQSIKQAHGELEYYLEKLKGLNADLEQRVKDRTMVLEEAIAELNKTKEELHDALIKEKDLNDLKSRFVTMASHEFRTPLATILSSVSLVTKYGELNEKDMQVKHINRIKSSINTLTDILNDVLSISKLEEGKMSVESSDFEINKLANEVIREMQEIARPGQKLVYHHKGESSVFLDKKIIKHILFNLISNAIKFSGDNKPVELNTAVGSKEIIIEVKDNGIGISEEDQKHLFERFFRANNATNIQGTGLGLNIVAKYVELLDGKISFKSKLEEGTTFTIELPCN